MSNKPVWEQPRLIAIDPFGGSRTNPYEFTVLQAPTYRRPASSVAWTYGGDNTPGAVGYSPVTDFDPTPAFGYVTPSGPFYVSTVAPLS